MEAFSLIEFAYRSDERGYFMVLKYQMNGKWQTDVRLFKQLGAADLYIKSSKKTWLLLFFENWLLNVKPDIHTVGSFQNVWLGYEDLCDCDLLSICNRIVKGQEILKQLLPNHTESNYCNDLENFEQLILFCQNEIEATNV